MGKGLRMQQEVKMAHCKMKRERARMDSQKQHVTFYLLCQKSE